jgi:hypothetical protein
MDQRTITYPPLPPEWTPELLKVTTLRETLLLIAQFGILGVADRVGYDELVNVLRIEDDARAKEPTS